jgi:hypothetical protein
MRSNQLNYVPDMKKADTRSKAAAMLPAQVAAALLLVGGIRIERMTFCL